MEYSKELCFCTLALGKNYRSLALELAKDIEKYSPEFSFVILTDTPSYFKNQSNVLAFKHHQASLGCYHDKRFVIAKALSLFKSCLFLDADIRILEPITFTRKFEPGITAKIVWENIPKHNKNPVEMKLLKQMAHKLNLRLEDISFVHECFFVVTKDSGKELEFLKYWDKIAPYFELRGFQTGEGHTIGLAAAKVGLPIIRDSISEIVFFKDKLDKQARKQNKLNHPEKAKLFVTQRALEYPQTSILIRAINKIIKNIRTAYIFGKLIISTIRDFRFYYK